MKGLYVMGLYYFFIYVLLFDMSLAWSIFPWSAPRTRVQKAKCLVKGLKKGKSRFHPDISVVSVGGEECGIQLCRRRKRPSFVSRKNAENINNNTNDENNDDIIFVDREEFLTPQLGLTTPVGQALQTYISCLENVDHGTHPVKLPSMQLAIYLTLYKRGLLPTINDNTSTAHYLNTLPLMDDISHFPLFWDNTMLKELQQSNVKRAIMTRRVEWHQEFQLLKKAMAFASLPECFQSLELKEWFWARSIITSRAFTDTGNNGQSCLCPYVDMMNHVTRSHSQKSNNNIVMCSWTIDSEGFHLRLPKNVDDDSTTKLEISYGSHSNGHFLINYGFSITDDSDQIIEDLVTLPIMLPNVVHENDAEALWEADGMGDSHLISRNVTIGIGDAGPMESVLSLCRVASTRDEELPGMKTQFLKRAKETIHSDDGLVPQLGATLCRHPFSASNEKRALEMLHEATQIELEKYETTLEEDNDILRARREGILDKNSKDRYVDDNSQLWSAIAVRRGEKQILHHYNTLASIGLEILKQSNDDFDTYKGMLEVSLEDPKPFLGIV